MAGDGPFCRRSRLLVSQGNGHKKFAFIHVQKTGGSSVDRLLRSLVPGVVPYDPRHMGARLARRRLEDWEEYFRFAFVRNPWDRLVSWYSMIEGARRAHEGRPLPERRRRRLENNPLLSHAVGVLDEDPTFEAFVRRCTEEFRHKGAVYSFARNQADYLTSGNGSLLVDFVGRFERLEADAAVAFAEIGLGEPKLPHANRRKRDHYSGFYTPELRAVVADRFAKDIERFGYAFEGPAT